jgi:hypothetical protein
VLMRIYNQTGLSLHACCSLNCVMLHASNGVLLQRAKQENKPAARQKWRRCAKWRS